MSDIFRTNDSTDLQLIDALEINGVNYKLDSNLSTNKVFSIEESFANKTINLKFSLEDDSLFVKEQIGSYIEFTPNESVFNSTDPSDIEQLLIEKEIIDNYNYFYVKFVKDGDRMLCPIINNNGYAYNITSFSSVNSYIPSPAIVIYNGSLLHENFADSFILAGLIFDVNSTEYQNIIDNGFIEIEILPVSITVCKRPEIELNYGVVALNIPGCDRTFYGSKKLSYTASMLSRTSNYCEEIIDLSKAVYPDVNDTNWDESKYVMVTDIKVGRFLSARGMDDIAIPGANGLFLGRNFTYTYSLHGFPFSGSLPDGMIFNTQNSTLYVNRKFMSEQYDSFKKNTFIKVMYEYAPGLAMQEMAYEFAIRQCESYAYIGSFTKDIADAYMKLNTADTTSVLTKISIGSIDLETAKKIISFRTASERIYCYAEYDSKPAVIEFTFDSEKENDIIINLVIFLDFTLMDILKIAKISISDDTVTVEDQYGDPINDRLTVWFKQTLLSDSTDTDTQEG